MDDNGPDTNMFPLEGLENDINQAMERLSAIQPVTDLQHALKDTCLTELNRFQSTQLMALRRAIENG
jgi:hypothetical protein